MMDYILCLDTSDEYLNIGIGNQDGILYQISGKTIYHSQFIQKYFNKLIEISKIEKEHIREILICNGPGSFTGLRVGTAFTYGLATALKIPVFSISKFSILSRKFKFLDGILIWGYECKDRKLKVLIRQNRIKKNEFIKKIKSIQAKRYYFCGEVYKSELIRLIKGNFKNSIIIPDSSSKINLSDLITYKLFAKRL
jgi:tRNA threonylcarbamoyl adenosine modification protein YeaZ